MKNEYLIQHLQNSDLSFLTINQGSIIETKNEEYFDITTRAYENESLDTQILDAEITDWSNDIMELKNYFKSITLPQQSIKLNNCTVIEDASKFIDNHLSIVKANSGNRTFLPYLNRLKELKQVLINKLEQNARK